MSTFCSIRCAVEEYATATAWFIISDNGSLYGIGKYNDDEAGEIKSGQVLSMQVDTDAGTLKFWVDGRSRGPDYTSGVTGLLQWTVTVRGKSNAVEIVPTPEMRYS